MEAIVTFEHFIKRHFLTEVPKTDGPDFFIKLMDVFFPQIGVSKFNFHSILLCIKGTATIIVGHHNFQLTPNTVSIIPPDTICRIDNYSEDFEAYLIIFKSDFLKKGIIKTDIMEELLFINQEYAPIFELDPDGFTDMLYKFERIGYETKNETPFYLEMVRLYLLQILYDYNRVCEICLLNSQKSINRQYQIVHEFRKLIDIHFRELRTVKEYADLLFISPKYLSQCVKEQLGISAISMIHKRIVLEAELLLNYSKNTIKEISDALHFDTPSHFSRFFKNIKEQTPGEYRNKQ